MAKTTIRQVEDQVGQLLRLRPLKEWYGDLEKAVKQGMTELSLEEVSVKGLGRVRITQSKRVTVPPEVAREVLGPEIAAKVIETKEAVSNDLIKALVQMKEISPEQRKDLLAGAKETPTVNLYVRPLK